MSFRKDQPSSAVSPSPFDTAHSGSLSSPFFAVAARQGPTPRCKCIPLLENELRPWELYPSETSPRRKIERRNWQRMAPFFVRRYKRQEYEIHNMYTSECKIYSSSRVRFAMLLNTKLESEFQRVSEPGEFDLILVSQVESFRTLTIAVQRDSRFEDTLWIIRSRAVRHKISLFLWETRVSSKQIA